MLKGVEQQIHRTNAKYSLELGQVYYHTKSQNSQSFKNSETSDILYKYLN